MPSKQDSTLNTVAVDVTEHRIQLQIVADTISRLIDDGDVVPGSVHDFALYKTSFLVLAVCLPVLILGGPRFSRHTKLLRMELLGIAKIELF